MNKKKSRILSCITALALSVSVLPATFITAHAENVTYIDENFDSYTADEIIKSVGNNIASTPEPVKLGDITYNAGRRGNQTAITASASIVKDESSTNQRLSVNCGEYFDDNRGIKLDFNPTNSIPAAGDMNRGELLELSFDLNMPENGVFYLLGSTVTGSAFGRIAYDDVTGKATHIRAIFSRLRDLSQKTVTYKYMIATDEDGNVVGNTVTTSGITNDATFGGISFREGKLTDTPPNTAVGTYTIDNLKLEKKASDLGMVTIHITDDKGTALEADSTTVKISGMELHPNINGDVTVVLPAEAAGKTYPFTVSNPAYEWHEDMEDDYAGEFVLTQGKISDNVNVELSQKKVLKYPVAGDGDKTSNITGKPYLRTPASGSNPATTQFTATIYDQLGFLMDVSPDGTAHEDATAGEYAASWKIYPAETPEGERDSYTDEFVSIDQNGLVSVKEGFTAGGNGTTVSDKVKKYIVELTASHLNDGETYPAEAVNVVKTAPLYIGESDIIHYSPDEQDLSHTYTERSEYYIYPEPIPMPSVTRSIAKLKFETEPYGNNGTDQAQRTWALVGNINKEPANPTYPGADPIVGLQYVYDPVKEVGTITAWTGFQPGSSSVQRSSMTNMPFSQSNDVGKFDHSFVYKENYTAGTEITVIMDIDNVNQYVTFIDDKTGKVLGILPYDVKVTDIEGAVSGTYKNEGKGDLHVGEVLISDISDDYFGIVGDDNFAKIKGSNVTRQYSIAGKLPSEVNGVTWSIKSNAPEPEPNNSVTFTLNKTATENMSAKLIRATYTPDNKLSNVAIISEPVSIAAGATSVKVPVSINGTYMLWDSINGMKPLAPSEEFTGGANMNPLDGVSIDSAGILSVTNAAAPGSYTITATSSSGDTASMDIIISDYQTIADGTISYTVDNGEDTSSKLSVNTVSAQFSVTSLLDSLGDNVVAYISADNITWSSSNPSIMDVDADTGATTSISSAGTTVITATISFNGESYPITLSVTVEDAE